MKPPAMRRTVSLFDGKTDTERLQHVGRDGVVKAIPRRTRVRRVQVWSTLGTIHVHKSGAQVWSTQANNEIVYVTSVRGARHEFANSVEAFAFVERCAR
jgi:hypothetical protein